MQGQVSASYSEEAALDVEISSQITRDSVIFVCQVLASLRWDPGFLDFTPAFHSGTSPENCTQPREGIPGAHPLLRPHRQFSSLVQALGTAQGDGDTKPSRSLRFLSAQRYAKRTVPWASFRGWPRRPDATWQSAGLSGFARGQQDSRGSRAVFS